MFVRRKPTSRATLIQTPHLPRVARVRGVAWSILGGSGPLDSGSNPDGPISVWRNALSGLALSRASGAALCRSGLPAKDTARVRVAPFIEIAFGERPTMRVPRGRGLQSTMAVQRG